MFAGLVGFVALALYLVEWKSEEELAKHRKRNFWIGLVLVIVLSCIAFGPFLFLIMYEMFGGNLADVMRSGG